MNNLIVGIKKFFTNKNTVTVVGIILAIVILYVGYNMRINQAITPITVPYAAEEINPSTQITEDMIATMEIPQSMANDLDIITNSADVIDMYANGDSVIPEGSLFYTRSVVSRDQLPDSIILDYPEGYVLYNLSVDMASTYSNSIYPGNYIDIYLKVQNAQSADGTVADDRIMVGRLLSNVKVIAVYDSSGNNVFSNLDEKGTPSQIIFAVPEEYHILLRKAEYLRAYESEIIPVPTAESLEDEPGDVTLSSEDLRNFINNVTAMTEEDLSYTQQ